MSTQTFLVLGILFSAVAVNAKTHARSRMTFECETEAGELVGCLSLPSEAPEQGRAANAIASKSENTNTSSLVSESDISGAAAPSLSTVIPNGAGKGSVNTAMLTALETEAQIQRVELFLKSGPAARGDLRVVESQVPR